MADQSLTMQRLYTNIAAACPIVGARIGVFGSSPSVSFDPQPQATQNQINAAQAIIDAFDWTDIGNDLFKQQKEPVFDTLKKQAVTAIAAIDTYLALADTATAVQVRAEVKAIDQRQKQIIQVLMRIIERIDT